MEICVERIGYHAFIVYPTVIFSLGEDVVFENHASLALRRLRAAADFILRRTLGFS
jgi:hypothetical protein